MVTKLEARSFSYFEDYEVFCEWCVGHGKEPLPLTYLPETGLVISQKGEPIVMLFLYFDDSTPTCFVERAITRPGLSVQSAAQGLCQAVEAAKECSLARGADLMILRAPKGMARYAIARLGFEVEEYNVVNMCFRLVRKEALCLGLHQ
jgi:hypothetical protein